MTISPFICLIKQPALCAPRGFRFKYTECLRKCKRGDFAQLAIFYQIRKLFRINVVYIMIDKEKERRVSFQKRQQAFGPAAKYCLFSYSEWWRYIGPVKPRQPLAQCFGGVGAHLSERPVGPIEQ